MSSKARKDNIRRAANKVDCSICGESVPPKGRLSVPSTGSSKAEFAHEKCYMRKYLKLRPDGKGGWETVTARGVMADEKRRMRSGKMPVVFWLVPLVFILVTASMWIYILSSGLLDNAF